MNSLESPFKHPRLFKDSKLLWRDFLELCAENLDCYMGLVADYQTDIIFDKPTYHQELRFFDCRCKVKLTDEQAEYFNERRRFYKKLYSKEKNIDKVLKSIPKFQEALSKVIS